MAIIFGKPVVGRLETLQYANKKFNWGNVVIGISAYYGLKALLYARLTGRKCIYYCIDYYTKEVQESFIDGIFIWLAQRIDKLLCKHVDEVWDISDRINLGRIKYAKYYKITRMVPLSYPPSYFRYRKCPIYLNCIFTGLVFYGKEVCPDNTEHIGKGEKKLEDLLDEISRHSIGISVWGKKGNNYYGDPGKTKLYSACGLPVIVTDNTPYADIIRKTNAGIVVRYSKRDIMRAYRRIKRKYDYYKSNVRKTWKYINADKVFRDIVVLE